MTCYSYCSYVSSLSLSLFLCALPFLRFFLCYKQFVVRLSVLSDVLILSFEFQTRAVFVYTRNLRVPCIGFVYTRYIHEDSGQYTNTYTRSLIINCFGNDNVVSVNYLVIELTLGNAQLRMLSTGTCKGSVVNVGYT